MTDGPLSINLQRRATGAPTLSLVRFKRHNPVSIVLDLAEIDAAERAIAEAKRLIAAEPNRPSYEITDLKREGVPTPRSGLEPTALGVTHA